MRYCEDKPASFIGKLCKILRSKEYAKTIAWDRDERCIKILNQKRLEEMILPKYFRHNHLSSFVRQLNMYDFHKVQINNASVFRHKEFDPKKQQSSIDRKDYIHLIKRKVTFNHKGESQKEDNTLSSQDCNKQNKGQTFEGFIKSNPGLSKPLLSNLKSEKIPEISKSDEVIIEQIVKVLLNEKITADTIKQKLKFMKGLQKYNKVLNFKHAQDNIYNRLGMERDETKDNISIDIIDPPTKKSFMTRSMKMLESGPLYTRKDTISMFFG